VWQKTLGTALDKNSDIRVILSAGDQTQHGDRANEWAGTLAAADLDSADIEELKFLGGEGSVHNGLIALTPGADATQLNFCWHSDDTAKSGVVRIGKSADMTSFKEFVGKASTDSYTGQSVYTISVLSFRTVSQ